MRFIRYIQAIVAAALFCAAAGAQTLVPNEVGKFQNAAPLNGAERILADQSTVTVNLTPIQIGQYLGIPQGLVFPLPIAFGGTGKTTAGAALLNLLPPLVANDCLAVNSGATNVQWATCGSGGAGNIQVNGVGLTSSSIVNFQNSPSVDGFTLSFSNPSAGNVQLGLSGALTPSGGGTGLSATPTNGQIPIGNGTGYSLATLTAGSNVTITNSAGGVTIASSAGGSGTVNSSTSGSIAYYASTGTAVSGESLPSLQAALIAANSTTCADSPATGPLIGYSPSCWGTAVGVLDVTPASGGTTICSLVAGSDKQDVILKNTGTAPVFLTNQCTADATSANRFYMDNNFMIQPGGQARITYVTATARWNAL